MTLPGFGLGSGGEEKPCKPTLPRETKLHYDEGATQWPVPPHLPPGSVPDYWYIGSKFFALLCSTRDLIDRHILAEYLLQKTAFVLLGIEVRSANTSETYFQVNILGVLGLIIRGQDFW